MTVPKNDAICATCGETYGKHIGLNCMAWKGGKFVEAVTPAPSSFEQTWSCYAVSSGRDKYFRRLVTADSLESARAKYAVVGFNTFVTAEPFSSYPVSPLKEDKLRERIALLGFEAETGIKPGPKKPAPAIVAEVHNKVPVDAQKAWEAVVASCGGRQS